MNIADLRKSYEKAELNENASHADPLKQFEQWLQEAIAAEMKRRRKAETRLRNQHNQEA